MLEALSLFKLRFGIYCLNFYCVTLSENGANLFSFNTSTPPYTAKRRLASAFSLNQRVFFFLQHIYCSGRIKRDPCVVESAYIKCSKTAYDRKLHFPQSKVMMLQANPYFSQRSIM